MASKQDTCRSERGWPLERVLFAMAGTVAIIGGLLALLVSPWFGLLAAFAGANQWLYVIFGACPASMILTRVTSLKPSIGVNR